MDSSRFSIGKWWCSTKTAGTGGVWWQQVIDHVEDKKYFVCPKNDLDRFYDAYRDWIDGDELRRDGDDYGPSLTLCSLEPERKIYRVNPEWLSPNHDGSILLYVDIVPLGRPPQNIEEYLAYRIVFNRTKGRTW